MKIHEMLTAVGERLSEQAAEWWAGAGQELIDEIALIAQRDGIDVAVTAIEELATAAGEKV